MISVIRRVRDALLCSPPEEGRDRMFAGKISDTMEVLSTDIAKPVGFEDLPDLVLEKLVEFLDYGSRRACRLVSKTLKEHVDNVGVSIKVMGHVPEISDFSKMVNVTEAQLQVVDGHGPTMRKLKLNKLKTAILSGIIDTAWLNNGLQRKCPNLHVLILNGDCLITQDFTGPPSLPVMFDNLTHLQISLTANKDRLTSGSVDVAQDNQAYARVQRNMVYLLSIIRSRTLKTFDGFIFPNTTNAPHENRWDDEPLFKFIEKHQNSLEELNLPCNLVMKDPDDVEQRVYQIPTKIKQLVLSGTQKDPNLSKFWNDLLLAQQSLEKLCLNNFRIETNAMISWLPVMLARNAQTLTVVRLKFCGTLYLDMSAFSSLESLEKLSIESYASPPETELMIVLNLNCLPRRRLTSLKIETGLIGDDFDGVKFMDGFQPKSLVLMNLSRKSFFKDHQYLFKFMKLVLRIRGLNRLWVLIVPLHLNRGPSHGEEKWNYLTTPVGLKLLLANLAKGPENHEFAVLKMDDLEVCKSGDGPLLLHSGGKDDDVYQLFEKCVNLDYTEVIARSNVADRQREQPFIIPRNAESYTIWKNQRTEGLRVLPNALPYSMRVDSIRRVYVIVAFLMEGTNKDEFRPVSLKDVEARGDCDYSKSKPQEMNIKRLILNLVIFAMSVTFLMLAQVFWCFLNTSISASK